MLGSSSERGSRIERLTTAVLAGCLVFLGLATPVHAAFPGANGRIAFERDLDECFNERINIYSVNPLGAMPYDFVVEKRLQPSWSPDGVRLAYYQDAMIAHSKFDGSEFQAFSQTFFDEDPTWSPDGTRIAWTGYAANATHIWAADPDGANAVQLTTGLVQDMQPAWSPDGSEIAFASDRDGDFEIYVMNADGSGVTQITSNATTDESPNWAPDGSRLAFARGLDIWTMRPDGTDPQQLTTGTAHDRAPAWSPDGAQIAFDRDRDIWTMTASGTGETNLTPSSVFYCDTNPDWQPVPVNTPSSFARPRGATPVYASLVPAHSPCTAPNRTHGAPLSFGACGPPTPTSANLTVGTPDANGLRANSIGFMELRVRVGALGGPDDSDVRIKLGVQSVYRASDLADYTGELEARTSLRLTDKRGGIASTTIDIPLSFVVPCSGTADPGAGGNCAIDTTADALRPGFVPEGERSLWGLDQAQVYDGGADGIGSTTGDNTVFAVQGVFVS